jgi:hypothetical protein
MKNVIDEYGNEVVVDGYTGEVVKHLKKLLKNFNEYLFILYGTNGDKPPIPLFKKIKHSNKILMWYGSENKRNNISVTQDDYKHIFSNYFWDTKKVTSIPLGYFSNPKQNDVVPIKERLYNISFVGCLNRNRLGLASQLSGINKILIAFGLAFYKKFTLKIINIIVQNKWNRDLYQFNPDFNTGESSELFSYFLRHTKIALCPRGWVNSETFRLYEAMRFGCVVITEELPDREYYKNIPVIQVKNWEDGLRIAYELINDNNKLETLSEQNKKFYEKFLSPKATAKIIAKKLVSCV